MESLTKFVLWLIATTNIIIIAMMTLMTSYISQHMVWDIDKVRNTYVTEVSYWYKKGCASGTKYPDEFKGSQNDYNVNSVPAWCDRDSRNWEDDFNQSSWKLGR